MIELLRERRSVRSFQKKTVEAEKIELLTESLVRSPSSRSINPWEFVVVDDSQTIQALSTCKPHGAGFLNGVPLAVVILEIFSALTPVSRTAPLQPLQCSTRPSRWIWEAAGAR